MDEQAISPLETGDGFRWAPTVQTAGASTVRVSGVYLGGTELSVDAESEEAGRKAIRDHHSALQPVPDPLDKYFTK